MTLLAGERGEDRRLTALRVWLRRIDVPDDHLTVASADASFRRYFRVGATGGTRIVMDSPPERENCEPFVRVAGLLAAAGVRVPEIVASDTGQGFLLLEDLGRETALQAVLRGEAAEPLLAGAIDSLVQLQRASRPGVLADYDAALLGRELDLFPDWFVGRELNRPLATAERTLWRDARARLIDAARAQAQVFVHRDFMLRNLMPTVAGGPAVIDFQDAVLGPLTYDLVSMLRDAFLGWPPAEEERWIARYHGTAQAAGLRVPDPERLRRDVDWMGAQRHLKVIGIFSRLCHRDGKCGYRSEIPRFFAYLRRELEPWPEWAELRCWLIELEAEACAR